MAEFWKDFDSIKELINLVAVNKVSFAWTKEDGCSININANSPVAMGMPAMPPMAPMMPAAVPVAAPVVEKSVDVIPMTTKDPEAKKEASKVDDADCKIVKSPLVGTFYAAASPEDEPFVKVGDKVKKGQKLAIIEAMKLMNDIESDYDGEIVEILVENEGMVEYGQPLFKIK